MGAFKLGVIFASAFCVAHIVNLFVGQALAPPLSRAPVPTVRIVEDARPPPLSATVMARELGFVSEGEPTAPPAVSRTALPMRLLGTLVCAEPESSSAFVVDGKRGALWMARLGDDFGGALVVSIERARVVLARHGRLEYIDGGPAPSGETGGLRNPWENGAGAWRIPRSDLHEALANLTLLAKQIRLVPAFVDGAPAGFKVFAIQSGSLYERVGLHNGDRIARVNGQPLDVDSALALYQTLPRARRIELEIERDGALIHHTYSID